MLRNSIQTLNFKINSIDKEKADEDEQKMLLTSKIENFVNIEENLIIDRFLTLFKLKFNFFQKTYFTTSKPNNFSPAFSFERTQPNIFP